MVTNPVSPADTDRQVAQSEQQPDQLESAKQYYFRQTEGMPQSVMSEDERGVLADARARNGVLGEEIPAPSVALLNKAAAAVEQDSFDYFSQRGGLPDDLAAWGATTQKEVFLGNELSEADESKLEGLKLAAKDNRKLAEAEAMEQDENRKEYGRTINRLKDQYGEEAGPYGDSGLLEAAAKIRTSEIVYDNPPSEKQGRLLKAADIQRKKGIAKQLEKDYKTSGVAPKIAEAAGDIKAQEHIFGTDLSPAQEKRIEQADRILTSVEGQLKRQGQQQFLESRAVNAYKEGRTTQALEDSGVPNDLAEKAAKIEVYSGGEPQNAEDADILSQAYAHAGSQGSQEGGSPGALTEIAANAEQFLDAASAAQITQQVGDTEIAQGNNYALSRTTSQGAPATTVIHNRETGGTLVAQGGEILAASGLDDDDQARFQRLGQLSPEYLQQSAQDSSRQAQGNSPTPPRPSKVKTSTEPEM